VKLGGSSDGSRGSRITSRFGLFRRPFRVGFAGGGDTRRDAPVAVVLNGAPRRWQSVLSTHRWRNEILIFYAGLDVSLRETSICILHAEGKVVLERKEANARVRLRARSGRQRALTQSRTFSHVTHSNWLCPNCDWITLDLRLASVASY
jgi:hypothetical protein